MSHIFVVFSLLFLLEAEAYNVLFMPMHYSPSHKKSMAGIAESLGRAGHSVVIWSPVVQSNKLQSKFLDDIEVVVTMGAEVTDPDDKHTADVEIASQIWGLRHLKPWTLWFPWKEDIAICQRLLHTKPEEVDKIVALKNWDLIIYGTLFAPCAFEVVKRAKNVPYIAWSTSNNNPPTVWAKGLPEPYATYHSFSAHDGLHLHTFFGRVENVFMQLLMYPAHMFYEWKIREGLAGFSSENFTFDDVDKHAVLAISQYPQLLDTTHPSTPDFLNILPECPSPKSLPANIRAFIEDPDSKGTILMAFGHLVRWSVAPPELRDPWERALEQLSDYRIIWQFDRPEVGRSLPSHVLKMKWLPQVEILAHPKTVAFVSHSGLKSTFEAACAGVPVVSFPQFAEQYRNAAMVRMKKIAVFLDKFDLTMESVLAALREVLEHDVYRVKARKMRDYINDQPLSASAFETYVAEFAIRQHKRIPRLLVNRGAYLSWWSYFDLDVITFFAVVVLTTLFALRSLLELTVRSN